MMKPTDMDWLVLLTYCEYIYANMKPRRGYNQMEMRIYDRAVLFFQKQQQIDEHDSLFILFNGE
jgi:hypothetical protein